VGADRCLSNEDVSEIETRASEEAADMLIPKHKLRSFILRTRPFYYTESINQFANLLRMHPGIIAGQLQFKNEIKWAANRAMLVKVRDILVSSALTDGWGVTIAKRK
jgi:HTH-type transcriptional regulator/antitoxin HigA